MLYRGLVLRQEEQPRELTELARVESARIGRVGADLHIEADGLKLHAGGARQAIELLGKFARNTEKASEIEHVTIVAPACEIEIGAGSGVVRYMLQELAGSFQTKSDAPSLTASYRVAVDEEASTRCELLVSRDRKTGGNVVSFRTMEGPALPAKILDPFFSTREWIGAKSRVEGCLTLSRPRGTDGEWEAVFEGTLGDIELGRLIDDRDPTYRLTGPARLLIRKARWSNRPGQGFGWSEMQGELAAGPGAIGVGLLRSFSREMRFRLNAKMERSLERRVEVAYRSLGVVFDLGSDGQLEIKGGLGDEFPSQAVLVLGDQITPLAFAPQGLASTRGLVRALFPAPADVLVPGTAEAQALQRYLPLPIDAASRAGKINSN